MLPATSMAQPTRVVRLMPARRSKSCAKVWQEAKRGRGGRAPQDGFSQDLERFAYVLCAGLSRRNSPLRILGFLCCDWRRGQEQRFLGHDDPGNRIRQKSDDGHKGHDQPDNADEGDIDVEIFGEAKAHPCDFSSQAWTNEFASRQRGADANSAISAYHSIVLNHFSAIVAVHS